MRKENKRLRSFVSGQGYARSNEVGLFEVKYQDKIVEFTSLTQARTFFNSLNEPAAIWDKSVMPELLELKNYD